ncbi:hypothetical protein [Brucella sp. JSBI001]|uniref:hypothetical protein n=1 Tax=Brucella sp. JSBI001 TaxID=2886044 RepID=UPI0022310231|nr:hypothetical protein [Brucella sp. JSBI001]UZD70900.1 hypothetical protein LJ361_05640 [Brucella sp. JSBI001]
MTKRAAIKQADLRRMAIVAKEEGVMIETEIEGIIYRISPYAPEHSNLSPRREKPVIRL